MNVVIVTLVKHQKVFCILAPPFSSRCTLFAAFSFFQQLVPLGKAQTDPRLSIKLYFPFKTA